LQIDDLESAFCNHQASEVWVDAEQMKRRTKEFAKRVIRLCRQLPNTREAHLIGDQLFRAGTSVGANYRAACRARSKADFIVKILMIEDFRLRPPI
jgi:Tfp pilus assembly protein PilO